MNEQNAAGGRVVTAPTNGAAGVIASAMVAAGLVMEHRGEPTSP